LNPPHIIFLILQFISTGNYDIHILPVVRRRHNSFTTILLFRYCLTEYRQSTFIICCLLCLYISNMSLCVCVTFSRRSQELGTSFRR
jgi:hypothetical protein